jgi:hypothetical protein
MTIHDGLEPVSTDKAWRETGESTARNRPQPVRFSAQKKTAVVLRLLRGDDMDLLSRALQLPAACLATWRAACLTRGQEALKQHPRDGRDGEIARLRAKLGEATMANALLRENLARVETGRPLHPRRSSRGARPPRPPPAPVMASPVSVGSGVSHAPPSSGSGKSPGARPPVLGR